MLVQIKTPLDSVSLMNNNDFHESSEFFIKKVEELGEYELVHPDYVIRTKLELEDVLEFEEEKEGHSLNVLEIPFEEFKKHEL